MKIMYERDMLVTKCTDTGVGIKSEDLNKLFKHFGKLDTTSQIN